MSEATKIVPVFDLGNVLVFVDEEVFFRRLQERCRSEVEVRSLFGRYYDELRVDRGGDFEALHPVLVAQAGLTMTPAELRLAWNDIFTLNPPMLEVVRDSPRPRVMLSNTNQPHIEWLRQRTPEVFALFDQCVLSHEVGARKPDAAIFRHVESMTGLAPERHLLIDDILGNIEGARAAGWRGIQFRGVEDCRRRLSALVAVE